jgi:hypothetical protein
VSTAEAFREPRLWSGRITRWREPQGHKWPDERVAYCVADNAGVEAARIGQVWNDSVSARSGPARLAPCPLRCIGRRSPRTAVLFFHKTKAVHFPSTSSPSRGGEAAEAAEDLIEAGAVGPAARVRK